MNRGDVCIEENREGEICATAATVGGLYRGIKSVLSRQRANGKEKRFARGRETEGENRNGEIAGIMESSTCGAISRVPRVVR